MCPVCRKLQYPANRTHNPQLHTRPATWKTTTRNTTGSNHCTILLSPWWWAYWCPKHVEQAIRSAIKTSVASSWHFISTYQTGYLPNKDLNLDSLRPGSREMERCRWERQNFPPLKEVQCLEEEEVPRFRKNRPIPPPPSIHLHGVYEGKTSLSTFPIKPTLSQQTQRIKTCRSEEQCLNKHYCCYVWLRWKRNCRLQTQRFLIRHSVGGSLQSATISIRTIY